MIPTLKIAQEKHKVDLLAFLFNSNIKKVYTSATKK